jgi:hypothetical protein
MFIESNVACQNGIQKMYLLCLPFSRKLSDEKFIWQVFWLVLLFIAFPSLDSGM